MNYDYVVKHDSIGLSTLILYIFATFSHKTTLLRFVYKFGNSSVLPIIGVRCAHGQDTS